VNVLYVVEKGCDALTGKCRMERLYLENFLLPESFEFLPKGMLPMCYPSDHADGNYIPNWAMWYVIELADYVKRSGDNSLADLARERVYELIHFFSQYLDEFGLLEKLDRWVFVEWSMANKFVQDVNFPSNMLYAGMLRAAGQLYGDDALRTQAETVLETVRDMAYDGTFFIDNAIRGEDGKLHLTRNRTETCQYYAFYFQAATPDTHSDLWNRLITEFGPHRTELGLWPEIPPSNAFIGNYLRLDLLASHGLHPQCLEETKGYFEYMADTTGTLWEHKNTEASCNHGFASHEIRVLYRDVLGVKSVDRVRRIVKLDIGGIPLDWCEGSLPTPEGIIKIKWEHNKEGELKLTTKLPKGWVLINETK
jgi:alpha-L-rhamnosidase